MTEQELNLEQIVQTGDIEFTPLHQGLGIKLPNNLTETGQSFSQKIVVTNSEPVSSPKKITKSFHLGRTLISSLIDNMIILSSFTLFLLLLAQTLGLGEQTSFTRWLIHLTQKPALSGLLSFLLILLFILYFLLFHWIQSPTLGEMSTAFWRRADDDAQ